MTNDLQSIEPMPRRRHGPARSVVDAMLYWAEECPARRALTQIGSKDETAGSLTFAQLRTRVLHLAGSLRRLDVAGGRVVVAMGQSLDYVTCFLASIAAGACAVPLYSPASERDLRKLRAVTGDCAPKVVVTDARGEKAFAQHGSEAALGTSCRLATVGALLDAPDDSSFVPRVDPQGLAFLQYTSGSTGDPKGVMVGHQNIARNHHAITSLARVDGTSIFVNWLPLFHDMGMIAMTLLPLVLGAEVILMAPRAFLRSPLDWLRAISKYRGTFSGGPNFAYDLCVDRARDDEIDALDLSCWQVAFNGAERIKASTLDRFLRRFEQAGFRRRALFPCYGLAESTLIVTGRHLADGSEEPCAVDVKRESLFDEMVQYSPMDAERSGLDKEGTPAITCVSLGWGPEDQTLQIVDPATWGVLAEGRVGEIWVRSDSIAQGYWNKPKATADTFHAYTTTSGEGPFLRTGDLGFRVRGQLHFAGRIKEIIVVHGVNHYPQDIEDTVQSVSAQLRPNMGAAFAVQQDALGVVQAVTDTTSATDLDSLCAKIRQAVLRVHGLAPVYVALVNAKAIPKTTSGKVQRGEIRRRVVEGQLDVVTAWRASPVAESGTDAVVWPGVDAAREEHPNGAGGHRGIADANATSLASPAVEERLKWLQDYCRSRIDSLTIDERRTLPPYVVLDLGNQGLLGMQVPKEYGGLGFGTVDLLRFIELLGSKDLTLALFVGLNNVLGVRPVLHYGSPELKRRYLPSLAAGRELAAFALTEPAAGSNPQAIRGTAQAADGGAYRLRATKIWSGSAAWAGLLHVFVKTVDRAGHVVGISGFAIPQSTRGLRQGPEALTMGMRGMVQNTVILDDAKAADWQVLGEVGHGMTVAQDTMCHGRLAIGATCLGGLDFCYQTMVRYAGERQISTGRLLANPHTRTVLHETMHAIGSLRALVFDLGRALDEGRDVPSEVLAACKAVSTEALWRAIDATMQLAGGRGYIESNFIPQVFRDARVLRVFEGPTETLHHFVGSSAVRTPGVVRSYLRLHLSEKEIADHYDSVLAGLSTGTVATTDGTQRHSMYLAAGEYVAALVLHAAVCGSRGLDDTRAWSLDRLGAAQDRLEGAAARLESAAAEDVVRAFADALDARVGAWCQEAARPDREMDPLLRRAPSPAPEAEDGIGHSFTAPAPTGSPERTETGMEVESFLRGWIAQRLSVPGPAIGMEIEFAALGLGSIDAVELSAVLAARYRLDIEPTALWSYPTVRDLAGFVTTGLRVGSKPSSA